MAEIIRSAFADEYSSEFDKQLKITREINYGKLELRFVDGINVSDLSKEKVSEVKNKLNAAGVTLSAIGSPLGKISLDDDLKKHIEKAKWTYSIAEELETKNIRMFSFYMHSGKTKEECRGKIFDWTSELIRAAEAFDVVLCHENEADIYGESPENCLDLLKYFDGRLKCVFDAGNFVLGGYDSLKAYDMLKDYIEYFHIKDGLAAGAIVPPGKGEAKLKEILALHKASSQKDFIITLEPHLQTFDGLNQLTGSTFDNPYKYENQEAAFMDAVKKLEEIL